MKPPEEKPSQAVIALFETEGCNHLTGDCIHKEMADVLSKTRKKELPA